SASSRSNCTAPRTARTATSLLPVSSPRTYLVSVVAAARTRRTRPSRETGAVQLGHDLPPRSPGRLAARPGPAVRPLVARRGRLRPLLARRGRAPRGRRRLLPAHAGPADGAADRRAGAGGARAVGGGRTRAAARRPGGDPLPACVRAHQPQRGGRDAGGAPGR